MFTDNKIHVAERDVAVLARTVSGGVNEPSDPKHFPVLGNSATSPRAMSRLHSSFKDRLLTDSRDASDNTGQSAADGTEAARATSRADYTRNTSPKIAAGRDFTQEILSAASSEASGCGAEGGQKVGLDRSRSRSQVWLHSSVAACHIAFYHGCVFPLSFPYVTALVAEECYACWGSEGSSG